MEEDNEDQRQFFSDLGASAEQAVQGVRGLEENYYMIHAAVRVAGSGERAILSLRYLKKRR